MCVFTMYVFMELRLHLLKSDATYDLQRLISDICYVLVAKQLLRYLLHLQTITRCRQTHTVADDPIARDSVAFEFICCKQKMSRSQHRLCRCAFTARPGIHKLVRNIWTLQKGGVCACVRAWIAQISDVSALNQFDSLRARIYRTFFTIFRSPFHFSVTCCNIYVNYKSKLIDIGNVIHISHMHLFERAIK